MTDRSENWDRVVDVVVVGSGGAALVAATLAHDGGAEVLVLEKADMLGGTTAVSGGVIWLPGNHVMEQAGVSDSREDALAYIRRMTMGSEPDPELIEIFVDTAPEMLRYLEDKTPVRTHISPLPDYYWTWGIPGNRPVPGRAVEANPYPVGTELPEWKERLVSRGTLMSLGSATTLTEDFAPQTPELLVELARREAEDIRPKGAALIAMLFKGLLERGVETMLSTPAHDLVVVDGAVIGIRAEHGGDHLSIGARKGVVLACGGFEWNPNLVRAHIGYDVKPFEPSEQCRRWLADGGRKLADAQLANMTSYWGTPVRCSIPTSPVMAINCTVRVGPGIPRHRSWSTGMVDASRSGSSPTMTSRRRSERSIRRPSNSRTPGPPISSSTRLYGTPSASCRCSRASPRLIGYLAPPRSVELLPEIIGINADALEATVERFNEFAARGEDPDLTDRPSGTWRPVGFNRLCRPRSMP